MTDNNHPITPPPELVQKLADGPATWMEKISKAYCAGADQELEACRKALKNIGLFTISDQLQIIRRPKPPSLKELNLKHLEVMERDGHYLPEIISDLRRAIESLPS